MWYCRMDKATETQIHLLYPYSELLLQTLLHNQPIQLVKSDCSAEIIAREVTEVQNMFFGSTMGRQEWVLSLPDQGFIGTQLSVTQMSSLLI